MRAAAGPGLPDPRELLAAYALDAVDDDERRLVEAHLSTDATARAEVDDLREVARSLTTDGVEPPAGLRGRVLGSLPPQAGDHAAGEPAPSAVGEPARDAGDVVRLRPREGATGRGRRRRSAAAWLTAAAAAVVLGGGGVALWSPWDDGERAPTTAPTPARTVEPRASPSGDDAVDADRVLAASDARSYPFTVSGRRARLVRSVSLDRAVLIADRLPAVPSGCAYQAWWKDASGALHSAGTVPGTSSIRAVLRGPASRAVGVGLSVEPAAGSKQPTTTPVALVPFA